MNYEDKEIQERFGKENPFRVPEGYFDQLTERVMSQLPEREQQAEHGDDRNGPDDCVGHIVGLVNV